MPTFKFTTTQAQRGIGNVINAAANNNYIGGSDNAGSPASFMAVYSTPMPTLAEISTLVKANLPTSILTFTLTNKATNSSGTGPGVIANIALATAAGTGTAVWFAMYSVAAAEESLVIGDITDVTTGTGAVLLNDTNIVAGRVYQMQNFTLMLPLSYTY